MFEVGLTSVRRTSDPVTIAVRDIVGRRDPVTPQQFDALTELVAGIIGRRFELKPTAARQAVIPILRQIVTVLQPKTEVTARRAV